MVLRSGPRRFSIDKTLLFGSNLWMCNLMEAGARLVTDAEVYFGPSVFHGGHAIESFL